MYTTLGVHSTDLCALESVRTSCIRHRSGNDLGTVGKLTVFGLPNGAKIISASASYRRRYEGFERTQISMFFNIYFKTREDDLTNIHQKLGRTIQKQGRTITRWAHNFFDMGSFSTRQKPLENSQCGLSNGCCRVKNGIVSKKL